MGKSILADSVAQSFLSSAAVEESAPVKSEKAPKKLVNAEDKRTYRINLAIKQSLGEQLKKVALMKQLNGEATSLNNFIEQILEDYIKQLND